MKQKKCKGTGKAIGYGCGNISYLMRYGLCKQCFIDWLYNTPHGKETLSKTLKTARNKITKEKAKKDREWREKNIDYSKKLQDKINEIVRLIDIGLPCLAKNVHANQMHAGHVYSRGSNLQIRYNLHNIHRQSAQSNHFQNEDGLFREGISNEYGIDYLNFISDLRQIKTLKYTNIEYREFYRLACNISNELRKNGEVFNKTDRLQKRNEINLLLGIYDDKYCIFVLNAKQI